MERSDLRALVRTQIQLDTSSLSDAQIDIYLNEGYDEVFASDVVGWSFHSTAGSVDTVADTYSYQALPATITAENLRRIYALIDTTNKKRLIPISMLAWTQLRADDPSAHGTATHYAWDQKTQKFLLYPTPSGIVSLEAWYSVYVEFASGDTATPMFLADFHTILVDWALHRTYEREEDYERSQEHRSRFEDRLGAMTEYYNRSVASGPLIFGGGHAHGGGSNLPFLMDAANGGAT